MKKEKKINYSMEDLDLIASILNYPPGCSKRKVIVECNIGQLRMHVFKHPDVIAKGFLDKKMAKEKVSDFRYSTADFDKALSFLTGITSSELKFLPFSGSKSSRTRRQNPPQEYVAATTELERKKKGKKVRNLL